jgi:non-ribosomal peptide synthetase component F
MAHLEWLLLIGYIDSLFAERTELKGQPVGTVPETLAQLYLQAMRHHAREAALLARRNELWQPTPDWRLDRNVIRLTLYLQERVGLKPGDRAAIVAEPGPDWLLADCAGLAAGAVSVAIDPGLPSGELLGALVEAGPKVIFASATALAHLDGGTLALPGLAEVIALGGAKADGVRTLAQVLELGGTLDTAERAQVFRANARAFTPDQPAICHHDPAVKGRVAWQELTQGAAVQRIAELWRQRPAQRGDRVYLAGPVVTLAVRLALHACLGDGYSMVVLGTAGRIAADLAEIGPHRIVAAPSLLAEVAQGAPIPETALEGGGGWRERARQLLKRGREAPEHSALREALGGRIRAIDVTGPLDPGLARQLRDIAAVGSAMD